jgi:hypothetical protein
MNKTTINDHLQNIAYAIDNATLKGAEFRDVAHSFDYICKLLKEVPEEYAKPIIHKELKKSKLFKENERKLLKEKEQAAKVGRPKKK